MHYVPICSIPALNAQKEIGVPFRRLQNDTLDYRMSRLRPAIYNELYTNLVGQPQTTALDLDSSVDQTRLLLGHQNGRVSLVDFTKKIDFQRTNIILSKEIKVCHKSRVSCIKWYPGSKRTFAMGNFAGNVCVLCLGQSDEMDQCLFTEKINDIEWMFVGDRALLAVALSTNRVHIRNVYAQQTFAELKLPKIEKITTLKAYNHYLYTGSDSGHVFCWDMRMRCKTNLTLQTSLRFRLSPIMGIKISTNFSKIIATTADHRVLTWDLYTHKFEAELQTSNMPPVTSIFPQRFDIYDQGNRLWTVIPNDHEIVMRGLNDPIRAHVYQPIVHTPGIRYINACVVRQRAQQVISACVDHVNYISLPDGDEYDEFNLMELP